MQQKFHSRRLYATSEVFAKFESFPISWLNRAAAFCHVHSGSRPLAVMVHIANYTVRIPHSMCLPNRFFVQGRGKLKISHKIIVNTARMSIISIFPGIISRDNVPKAIISSCEVYGKFVTQQAFQFFWPYRSKGTDAGKGSGQETERRFLRLCLFASMRLNPTTSSILCLLLCHDPSWAFRSILFSCG